MRIDFYTKTILALIALALVTLPCTSLVKPGGVAAESPLASVQTKSGDVWAYILADDNGQDVNKTLYVGKITQLAFVAIRAPFHPPSRRLRAFPSRRRRPQP